MYTGCVYRGCTEGVHAGTDTETVYMRHRTPVYGSLCGKSVSVCGILAVFIIPACLNPGLRDGVSGKGELTCFTCLRVLRELREKRW